jgi:hypothetical protein
MKYNFRRRFYCVLWMALFLSNILRLIQVVSNLISDLHIGMPLMIPESQKKYGIGAYINVMLYLVV